MFDLLFLLVLWLPNLARGQTCGVLYVSPSAPAGNSSSVCTPGFPCSLTAAVNRPCASLQLILAPGVYTGSNNCGLLVSAATATLSMIGASSGSGSGVARAQWLCDHLPFIATPGLVLESANTIALAHVDFVSSTRAVMGLSTLTHSGGAVSVQDCSFNGAGLYVASPLIHINASTFRNFVAQSVGNQSALTLVGSLQSEINVTHSLFVNNTGPQYDNPNHQAALVGDLGTGGALNIFPRQDPGKIEVAVGVVFFVNCTFVGNSAPTGGAINVGRAEQGYNGGETPALYGMVTFLGCVFTDNHATKTWGGALNIAQVSNNNLLVAIVDSTFASNSAQGAGGAISCSTFQVSQPIPPPDIWFNFQGVQFLNNSVTCTGNYSDVVHACYGGGAVFLFNELQLRRVQFTGCVFEDNMARQSESGYGGAGGALCLYFVHVRKGVHMDHCVFKRNSADFAGGALYVDVEGFSGIEGFDGIRVSHSDFHDNQVLQYSGGAVALVDHGTATFEHCIFHSNHADIFGGCISVQDRCQLNLHHTEFHNCSAGEGGGVYSEGVSGVEMHDVKFLGNRATERGGALSLDSQTQCVSHRTEFSQNSALTAGALLVTGQAQFADYMSYWTLNTAARGGAIFAGSQASVYLEGPGLTGSGGVSNGDLPAFRSNHALGGSGGAVYVECFRFQASGVIFAGNSASDQGGAMCVPNAVVGADGTLTGLVMTDCAFEGNTAKFGGAFTVANVSIRFPEAFNLTAIRKGNLTIDTKTNLQYDLIADLYVPQQGLFSGCRFINNSASRGGALFISANQDTELAMATFDNCAFTYNHAHAPDDEDRNSAMGGAIYVEGTGSGCGQDRGMGFEFVGDNGNVFASNWAEMGGGAIYWDDCSPLVVTNSTASVPQFPHNHAQFGDNFASGPRDLVVNIIQIGLPPAPLGRLYPGVVIAINLTVIDFFNNTFLPSMSVHIVLCDGNELTAVTENGVAPNVWLYPTGEPNTPCPITYNVETTHIRLNHTFPFGACPVGFGYFPTFAGCSLCPKNAYSLDNSPSCEDCGSHMHCVQGEPIADNGYWLETIDLSVVIAQPCPPGFCENGGCAANRIEESPLCGECEHGYSEWNNDCIPCDTVRGDIIFGSMLVSWLYVVALHLVIQKGFGFFSILIFYLQIAVFILYPEANNSLTTLLGKTLFNIGGDVCPFPIAGSAALAFDFIQSIGCFFFLAWTFLFHRALMTCFPLREHELKHSGTGLKGSGVRASLHYYGRTSSYVRTLIAFFISSYEPIAEFTFDYVVCINISDDRIVSKHPDVHCASQVVWYLYFLPLLLYCALLPMVVFYFVFHFQRMSVAVAWIKMHQRKSVLPMPQLHHAVPPPSHNAHNAHAATAAYVSGSSKLPGGGSGGVPVAYSAGKAPHAHKDSHRDSHSHRASIHLSDDSSWRDRMSVIVGTLLTPHFQHRYYWWEVWSIVKRLLLLIAYVIQSNIDVDIHAQRLSYFSLIAFYLTMHILCQPFAQHRTHNALETLSLTTLLVVSSYAASQSFEDEGLGTWDLPLHQFVMVILFFSGAVLGLILLLSLIDHLTHWHILHRVRTFFTRAPTDLMLHPEDAPDQMTLEKAQHSSGRFLEMSEPLIMAEQRHKTMLAIDEEEQLLPLDMDSFYHQLPADAFGGVDDTSKQT